jgi:hypothetical protein
MRDAGRGRHPLRDARTGDVGIKPRRVDGSPTDTAASFKEVRVEARVLALASEGRIKESAAAPGHWMIA